MEMMKSFIESLGLAIVDIHFKSNVLGIFVGNWEN
jgi:hypothetical protein